MDLQITYLALLFPSYLIINSKLFDNSLEYKVK